MFNAQQQALGRPSGAAALVGPELAGSPLLYPHGLDPIADSVRFVRLDAAGYAEASFLDARAIAPDAWSRWMPLSLLVRDPALAAVPERLGYIFHIGHAGSTLVSRLLGALPGMFCLREPTPLGGLARLKAELDAPESLWSAEAWQARLGLFLRLWSRTFEPGQVPVVKAASWASELAAGLLSRPVPARAVCLTMEPRAWLASTLASPGGMDDVHGAAQACLRRLHRRVRAAPWRLIDLSPGERAAMTWLCETAALAEARAVAGERLLWLDFDRFLADPTARLAETVAHFGGPATDAAVAAAWAGPIARRYSKQPDVPFDAAMRARRIDDARLRHAGEIGRGVAWLDRACADFPGLAAARDLAITAARA